MFFLAGFELAEGHALAVKRPLPAHSNHPASNKALGGAFLLEVMEGMHKAIIVEPFACLSDGGAVRNSINVDRRAAPVLERRTRRTDNGTGLIGPSYADKFTEEKRLGCMLAPQLRRISVTRFDLSNAMVMIKLNETHLVAPV